MTNTRYKILFYLFSIFLALSLFAISVIYVLASPTHNIGSQINVNYVAPVNVNLNFVNNTGSDIEEGSYSIKYNEDITQFYIDGIIPSQATYQDGSIINDKGQEFYYFSNVPQDMEGNVIGNAGEGTSTSQNSSEENVTLNENVSTLTDTFVNIPENKNILAKRYYPSSSTDPIWYDLPETDIELYSTFLTPNCTDGTDVTIGTNTDIVISHQVTSIPNDAFRGSSLTPGVVTSVVIPNGIISIGSYAFYYNYRLSSVVLPSTLTTINTYAFYNCYDLTNITVPQKVSSIGSSAFSWTSKLIEVYNLSSLKISANYSSSNGYIGYNAEEVFNSINYVSKLKYSDSNSGFIMYENLEESNIYLMGYIGKSANLVLPTTSYDYDIYEYAFYHKENIVSVEIPSSVTSIGRYAFDDCRFVKELHIDDLTSYLNCLTTDSSSPLFDSMQNVSLYVNGELTTDLVIQEGITAIRDSAFRHVNLSSVVIPSSVTSIEDYAFTSCSNLASITIPSSVTSIGSTAFYRCSSLETINFEDNSMLTSIGSSAFGDCRNLISIAIPESVTSIGNSAFSNCSSLTSITIPSFVASIGSSAFKNCSSLTSITIPSSVASIGSEAFYDCSSLESVNFEGSSNLTSIGESAFEDCSSLENVNFEDGSNLTSIGVLAFEDCRNLTSITIPSTITSIGSEAFKYCSKLQKLYIEDVTSYLNSLTSDTSSPLYDTDQNVSLYVNGELATVLVIPEAVTTIQSYAFDSVTNISSVVIPSSVTSIGSYAFRGCTNIKELHINDTESYLNSLTSTSSSPMYSANQNVSLYVNEKLITDLIIPDTITEIPSYAFRRLNISSVVIPSGVTSIGTSAFSNCRSLTSITIPESVTSIGGSAFTSCYKLVEVINLSSLNVTAGNSSNGSVGYYAINIKTTEESGIYYLGDNNEYVMYQDLEGNHYLVSYNGTGGDITLPTLTGNQSYSINRYAFYDNDTITSVTLPSSVTSIGYFAFENCYKLVEVINLSSIEIIAGVTSNGYVGYYAKDIKTEDDTSGIYNVGDYLMYEDLGGNHYLMRYLGSGGDITLPTLTGNQSYSINQYAFYNNDTITSVAIPNSVVSIGSYAFYDCGSLTSITIPSGVTSIGDSAFYDCGSLTSITIPESVTSIGSSAFRDCSSLTSITIPERVTSIGSSAFYGCSSLTSITIPSSVTNIGNSAFNYCTNLQKLYIEDVTSYLNSLTTDTSSPLYDTDQNIRLYVNGALITDLVIPEGITTIPSYAFRRLNISSVTILESVTSIGDCAFENCSSLTSITIPSSVASIGSEAFYDCSSLESVNFEGNSNLTSIGESAFYDCSSLTGINLPEGIKAINDRTFYGCSNLTSITIPSSVTRIGEWVFYNCSSLASVTFEEGSSLSSIGGYAFYHCSNITSITIPKSVTRIASWAFADCGSLTGITLPEGIKTIYGYTFYMCSSFTSITIPSSVTSIASYAFHQCYKLVEVINLSSIEITAGVTSNGYVGYYAKDIKTEDDISRFYNIGDYLMYQDLEGNHYLMRYLGSGGDITLPILESNQTYTIYQYAFYYNDTITGVTIPSPVVSIGSSAFANCSSLVSVTFEEGSSLTSIGERAFYSCSSLASVTFGEGSSLTSIGDNAFYSCSSLTSIALPISVVSVGGYAFSGCDNVIICFEAEDSSNITLGSNWDYYSSRPVFWGLNVTWEYDEVTGEPRPI